MNVNCKHFTEPRSANHSTCWALLPFICFVSLKPIYRFWTAFNVCALFQVL